MIIRTGDASANWVVLVLGGLTGVVIKNCEIVGPGLSATTQNAGIYVIGDSQVTIEFLQHPRSWSWCRTCLAAPSL